MIRGWVGADPMFALIPQNTNMAYPKKMAIRDYLAIFLRSKITRSIQKTMAIDRKQTGSRGLRQDRQDRSRVF